MSRGNPIVDFIGRRFGRLLVLEFAGLRPKGNRTRPQFKCRCDCGNEIIREYGGLHTGVSTSCGCLTSEKRTTHGGTRTAVYFVWRAMHDRCTNPYHREYKNYGARGIHVCDRWRDFASFRDDMGPRPEGGTLERNEVNGNYEPGNCRWATMTEQQNNRRDNNRLTYQGVTLTLAQWARRVGVSRHRLAWRVKAGWPAEEVLTKPWSRGERRDLKGHAC